MGVLNSIGHFLKNPIQPITHAIGKTAGVTVNTHNGIHLDPAKLLTDAMALTGNPYAIAGVVGNGINAISPNSTLGHLGSMVGSVAPIAGGLSGGLSSLSSLPGASRVASAASSIPGASTVGSLGSKALGVLGLGGAAAGTAVGAQGAPDGGWSDPTGGVLGAVGIGSKAGTAAAGAAGAAAGGAGGLLGWLERNPALAAAGASLIGNTVGGIGQGQVASANRAEQQREFNMGYGLNANAQAMQAGRAAQTAPLRDQAQYLLQQRLGLSPQAFQPHDMYNQTTSAAVPQMGGVNLTQYGQRASQYTPGAGGQSPALQQSILQKLGYGAGGVR